MIERDLNQSEKDIYIKIGKKISEKRKSSRKKIQGISNKLNINIEYIENIEKGQLEKIPSHLPIRGFVRSYAKLIGTDISGELSELKSLNLSNNGKLVTKIKSKKNEKSLFVYIVVIFVFIFIGLYFFTSTDNQKKLNEINTPYGINYNIINKKS
ncbi:MAG: hypothetical protein CMM95_02200 [Rickettsiales bacterium]|nr:hypothetical protein [Rickettsiales bacterium]